MSYGPICYFQLTGMYLIYAISMGSIKTYGILSAELMDVYGASASASVAIGSVRAFVTSMFGKNKCWGWFGYSILLATSTQMIV